MHDKRMHHVNTHPSCKNRNNVHVTIINEATNNSIILHVPPNTTIQQLNKMIEESDVFDPMYVLEYNNKTIYFPISKETEIQNSKSLKDYNMKHFTIIRLVTSEDIS